MMSVPENQKTEQATESTEGLLFVLPATAANVSVIRHAVAGLAETLGMEEIAVADLKTIVSEACTNVAVHAYGDEGGPMEVQVIPDEAGITVAVRDQGTGIRPRPDFDSTRLRLGLPLIAALASSFSVSGGLGQGTEIVMRMELTSPSPEKTEALPTPKSVHGTTIKISDERIVAPVIGRVLAVLGARTDFPLDRLTDTMLLADALAAHAAAGFEDRAVRMVIEDGDGSIRLRVGPMQEGGAERLREELAIPGLGSTLEKLADGIDVDRSDDGEFFHLVMHPARGGEAAT
jgi:anti-sigma regulatory factor (Ser/Thr protein kinase)